MKKNFEQKSLYLGIDIGGTAAKMGIVDSLGNILYKNQYNVSFDNYETPILETVLKKSKEFILESKFNIANILGIGISATGQIDTPRGLVVGTGGNIRNWDNAPIKEEFEKLYNLPVTVVNDANCVALGEKWIGNAKDTKNALILTIGTGLGGGIIVNDKILLGRSGLAGEIGHFSINNKGRVCTCGNLGCFEQYASMTALLKQVKNYLDENAIRLENKLNGFYIFEAIKNNDSEITTIVETWIEDIACGITSLVHIFNPEVVLIGGGVSTQKELFVDKLDTKLNNKIMPNFRKGIKLLPAKLGNDAGLIGAVYYLLDTIM